MRHDRGQHTITGDKAMLKRFFTFIFITAAALMITVPAFALRAGDTVRDITLTDLQGKSVSLSHLRGQKVVLNFWATWCPPCRSEMPEFVRINDALCEKGEAVLLMVNLTDGRRDTKERVREFISKKGYSSLRVLLDQDGRAADYFGIRYIPTTFVIGSDGKISGAIQGATTEDAVMKLLKNTK